MYALSMAMMEPEGKAKYLSIIWSCVAIDVKRTRQGTFSAALMTVGALIPPFFLPVLGFRPAPLRMLENKVIAVESKIYSLLTHSSLRLSGKSCNFAHCFIFFCLATQRYNKGLTLAKNQPDFFSQHTDIAIICYFLPDGQ